MNPQLSAMPISRVMHRHPTTLSPAMPLALALERMREGGFRHLPVMDANTIVGVISDRDIQFALRVDQRQPEELLVRDAFTTDPYVVEESAPLWQVAAEMAERTIGCALVADHGRLTGIFTTVDACRALSTVLLRIQENGPLEEFGRPSE